METSLNSSPESTVHGVKSVFKKPTDFYQVFEVSMEESVTVTQSNKSDFGLDVTSASTNEAVPFKKSRKSVQRSFNVSSGESLPLNDSEQSVTFTKPQPLFTKQNKSVQNCFNVSFNETNSQASTLGKSFDVDDSVTTYNKANPFKKKISPQNEVSVQMEPSMENSVENGNENENVELDPSAGEVQLPSCSSQGNVADEEEADSTTFVTKLNPFKKSMRPENVSVSKISVMEESDENSVKENITPDNGDESDNDDVSIFATKTNPFKQKVPTENEESVVSITKLRSIRSPESNDLLQESANNSNNISRSKNISKLTSNESYLEQSSINDDNLNNWMSDQSDEEIPPPTVPSVTSRLSNVKRKQTPSDTPSPQINQMSIWEQKLNEIVSNAEKKSIALKIKTKSVSPEKKNSVKKSKVNTDKSSQIIENIENKYKPPKLLKPASFATKQFYAYIMKKLEPKYGIDTAIESENLVSLICDAVKKVTHRKTHQKKLIQNLKKEMAKAGLIETTIDFHEFIIKFLPYSFRVKVIPCLQPVTNMVYPPKDVANPFDKVL